MIIFFDLDSTLVKIEGLDEIAKWKGVGDEIQKLTELGMSGGKSFRELLPIRLQKISPSVDDFKKLDKLYAESLVDGTKELFDHLRKKGIKVGIITGGFIHSMDEVIKVLGVDRNLVFANEVTFDDDGNYDQLPEQMLINDDGKVRVIKKVRSIYGDEPFLFVGDSVRDIDTKGYVNKFIGYGGVVERSKVREESDHFIKEILDLIKIIEVEFPNKDVDKEFALYPNSF